MFKNLFKEYLYTITIIEIWFMHYCRYKDTATKKTRIMLTKFVR